MTLVLEPIFEADLDPEAYGYRPGRSAVDAVRRVHGHLRAGYTDVVDADLSKYFDTIPHGELLECVARRIGDKHVLALIEAWLKAPVEERTATGGKRLTGGKGSKHGTPQGGVISPLLANVYMNRFLKYWRRNGLGQRLRAHVVVYADDLAILTRGFAQEAHTVLKDAMTRIGLTVNETETKLRQARTERFDFLGYTFGPYWDRRTGQRTTENPGCVRTMAPTTTPRSSWIPTATGSRPIAARHDLVDRGRSSRSVWARCRRAHRLRAEGAKPTYVPQP